MSTSNAATNDPKLIEKLQTMKSQQQEMQSMLNTLRRDLAQIAADLKEIKGEVDAKSKKVIEKAVQDLYNKIEMDIDVPWYTAVEHILENEQSFGGN